MVRVKSSSPPSWYTRLVQPTDNSSCGKRKNHGPPLARLTAGLFLSLVMVWFMAAATATAFFLRSPSPSPDSDSDSDSDASSPSASAASVDAWCHTPECKARLDELHSKLALETRQYHHHQHVAEVRARSHPYDDQIYTQEAILQQRRHQVFADPRGTEYTPEPEWSRGAGSFPELNVVANLKTGTSQLYNVLSTHRDVATFDDDWKEHCSVDHYGSSTPEQDSYQYALYQWHQFYYSRKQQSTYDYHVNGCIMLGDLERRYAYNPPIAGQTTKFVILLRDPADWAWGSYNFFCDPSWERYEPDDNWVQEKLHYRSPEVFHEVVLSGQQLLGSELLTELKTNSIHILRRTQALVGKDNLIVLKNEDLQPHRIHSSGLLEKLSLATGLAMEGFDRKVLESRSNCNANKGYGEKCQDDRDNSLTHSHSKVGYPVTSNRPMLEATRRFLYLQWHDECRVWAEEFGIVYPECLAAVPTDDQDHTIL